MKAPFYLALGALALLIAGCQKNQNSEQVVSQRYIHKYGYAVSKEEWNAKQYPGQVITVLRNGVTVTATYENGILHGPCTHTFPQSQTVEFYRMYNQGELVKEITYDTNGMPVREEVKLSPTRVAKTLWYSDGSPLSMEEYVKDELLEGQYFSRNNETEARVEKGMGVRVRRDQQGVLLSKEEIESGYVVKEETFHPNGAPKSIAFLSLGKPHGEKKIFEATGEPLAVEEWINGQLHGKSIYFKNGVKVKEIFFLFGQKDGLETHFIDGQIISQQIQWVNDKKHGPSTFYVDGVALSTWYYDGRAVSKTKYDELDRVDMIISGNSFRSSSNQR